MSIINVEVRKRARISLIPAQVIAESPASIPETATAPTPHEVPQGRPNNPGEALITRTFTAMKAFQREHERSTGVNLSNAAAVDLLLRERLPYRISPRAVTEMLGRAHPGERPPLRGAVVNEAI
jgi:hypothetical protein